MTGKSRGFIAIGVVAAVVLGTVVMKAVIFDCRWGTFAYQVAVHKSAGQEDRRADAAVLVEGEETVVTANHHVTDVELSPDGKQIVVTSATGLNGNEITESEPTGLYIHDADGSDVRLLTKPGGYSPTWSPDGETIAFLKGRSIWTVDVDDGEDRMIYKLPPSNRVDPPYLGYMSWSGDSERIAFTVGDSPGGNGTSLWTMNRDGSDLERMWTRSSIGSFDWSPDGERFAYEGSYKGVSSLMLVDRDGKNEVQVEPFGYSPVWSRDGSQLAYVIGHEGHYDPRILVGNSNGKQVESVPFPKDAEGGTSMADWVSC